MRSQRTPVPLGGTEWGQGQGKNAEQHPTTDQSRVPCPSPHAPCPRPCPPPSLLQTASDPQTTPPRGPAGSYALEPYGWVATMNAPCDAAPDPQQRLALQAGAEEPFFRGAGLQRLVEGGCATTGALVDRLKAMVHDHLLETWAAKALALLAERLDVHVAEYESLGLPAVCAAPVQCRAVPVFWCRFGWDHNVIRWKRESDTRCARGACSDLVDLPTYSTGKCMCFQAVRGITIAHTALCPPTVAPTSLSWPPAGIVTVTCIRSNGDTVPAPVISASQCGQYVSIECIRS